MSTFPQCARSAFPLILAALALTACGSAGQTPRWPADVAIAETINGEPVPTIMLELIARERQADLAVPEQREKVVGELRQYIVLDQLARKQDYARDPKFLAATELYRLQGVAEAARLKLADGASVDDAALKAEYDRQVALAGPSEYDFAQLVFANEDAAINAVGDAATKPFDAVVATWREKAKQAQTFTRIRPSQLPEALGKALSALAAGETSKLPVKTDFGWVVLHVNAVNAVTPPPFEQVKDGVRATVLARYADQQIEKLLADAKVDMKTPPAAKN